MKDNMDRAWLLVSGPMLDAGFEPVQMGDLVNAYIKENRGYNRRDDLIRALAILGIPNMNLDPGMIKSPVELESFKRKVERIAVDTALCVIYLGLEKTIDADKLQMVFLSAALTRAEIEHGLTTYDELERELLTRVKDLGKISIEDT